MNAMDLLNKLPTIIITDVILTYFNLTEVRELRALNSAIKKIISMNRQLIFLKCCHVLPHGVVELLSAAGRLKQISQFKEGKKHGEERDYVDSWMIQICTFKEGKKHGEERDYGFGYDPLLIETQGLGCDPLWRGQRRVTLYKDGQKHGVEKHYSNYGVLKRTTPFIEGQKHGEEKYFNQDVKGVLGGVGVLVQTTPFKEGQLHGEEKKWNIKGVLTEMTTFKEGQQIRTVIRAKA
jgi:antitoxin component YwqK of YwqJK toxin-antitoxin module